MKMHRALFRPLALSLLIAIVGGPLGWESAAVHAADSGTTSLVPINGTVSGTPESVVFSGDAKVNSRLAKDPDFNSPSIVLSIDLTGLSGVGSSTKAKYVISGPEIVQRRLAGSYLVEITFPFVKSGSSLLSARSGVASFALNVNTATGAVTSGTGNIASPNF